MRFYAILMVVNVACFLPLYVLNVRRQPNPFLFLSRHTVRRSALKFLYTKPQMTDPFRIHFDFTFAALLAAGVGLVAPWMVALLTLLLAFGFIEILYTAIMHSVFKRPPSLASDLSLIRAGLKIAQRHAYWIVPAVVGLAAVIVVASYQATRVLYAAMPNGSPLALVMAALLVAPCFYHWRIYAYAELAYRTVYSPILHFLRNLASGRRLRSVLATDPERFDRNNHFEEIVLERAPNIIMICIESYGSLVFRDRRYGDGIAELLRGYEPTLARAGYRYASNYSEAPLFAGGSWLSYTAFTYGLQIRDLQLHDDLFSHDSAFAAYESLFHVLKRNGYENHLLCPLGGIDAQTVDWNMIDRCFQSDRRIAYDTLAFRGPLVSYLGSVNRYAPPDQYSLNFAYESAIRSGRPFSLFFCTLNSHIPWRSPLRAAPDWRALDDPRLPDPAEPAGATQAERYRDAIRYQLDYILQFALDRAADDPLIVLFGDHQPPLITPEHLGKETPVHVIGRAGSVIDVLLEHGFVPSLSLEAQAPRSMQHAGFLSLFLKALNRTYGRDPALAVAYRSTGLSLFDEELGSSA